MVGLGNLGFRYELSLSCGHGKGEIYVEKDVVFGIDK